MFSRTLIVVAHPDDEILGCGGFLAKYSNKIKFQVLFMAEGSSCRFDSEDSIEAKAAINQREKYARQALSKFKPADIKFTNLPCGRLDQVPIIKLNKIIEQQISDFLPTTIFTHSEHDTNSDHRRVAEAVLMATRPGALNYVKNLFSIEIPSSTEWNFSNPFTPNYFIGLSEEELKKKIEALLIYASEIRGYPFPRSKEGLKAFAKYRGVQSGNAYAESFKIIRIIETVS